MGEGRGGDSASYAGEKDEDTRDGEDDTIEGHGTSSRGSICGPSTQCGRQNAIKLQLQRAVGRQPEAPKGPSGVIKLRSGDWPSHHVLLGVDSSEDEQSPRRR